MKNYPCPDCGRTDYREDLVSHRHIEHGIHYDVQRAIPMFNFGMGRGYVGGRGIYQYFGWIPTTRTSGWLLIGGEWHIVERYVLNETNREAAYSEWHYTILSLAGQRDLTREAREVVS